MTKYTLIGLLACMGGGVLIGFQKLAGVMGTQMAWMNLSVGDVVGEQYLAWMQKYSFAGFERISGYIGTMPLYVLLFFIGGLFFVLDYFLGRR